jgi:hypothetical protein
MSPSKPFLRKGEIYNLSKSVRVRLGKESQEIPARSKLKYVGKNFWDLYIFELVIFVTGVGKRARIKMSPEQVLRCIELF